MTAARIRFLCIGFMLNELLKQIEMSFETSVERLFQEGTKRDYQYFEGGA